MDLEALRASLRVAAGMLACALLFLLAWRRANARRVGPVRHLRRRRVVARGLVRGASAAAAVGIGACALASDLPRGLVLESILVLALAPLVLFLSPGFQDSFFGEQGVQRGWTARRFHELEAWRLIGEHLRWRLRGTWLATDVPAGEHAALRERLSREAPGRENAHGNAGFDPQRAASAKSNS